jgi:hypothetical protein
MAHFHYVLRGHVLDAFERLSLPIQTSTLEREEWLVLTERFRKTRKREDLASNTMHAENRRKRSTLVDGYQAIPIWRPTLVRQKACEPSDGPRLE